MPIQVLTAEHVISVCWPDETGMPCPFLDTLPIEEEDWVCLKNTPTALSINTIRMTKDGPIEHNGCDGVALHAVK